MPKAVIFGCEAAALNDWEKAFFEREQPVGFILFARNCEAPDQIRDLVRDLRALVGRDDAPVLIDQEGGRVARLKPPTWRAAPAAARFGALAAHDAASAEQAVRLNARLIAEELHALGINVDCAPVLDLHLPETHEAIGDRAYGGDPALVARLGRAVCAGLLEGGVLPVVKHMPGHGRAKVDSHLALPVVQADLATLERSDFAPFRDLSDAPWAMTGHLVFQAIDPADPATTSRKVIEQVIRGSIGFDGVLVSDDLSMQALSGGLGERTRAALEAGCDLALHCNAGRAEMTAVAGAAGELSGQALERVERAGQRLAAHREDREPIDTAEATRALDALLVRA